jgi:hypothetical protein
MATEYLAGLPRTKPVIAGVVGDGAGHIYTVPTTAQKQPGTTLDVFRESGEYLGHLELPTPMWMPPSGPIVVVTRDYLYYVAADDADVPRIVRLRIARPG